MFAFLKRCVSVEPSFMRKLLSVGGRRELGECYWRELRELVDSGEVSLSFAQRIAADLFEGDPAIAPVLKHSVWLGCVNNIVALFEIEALRRLPRHP